MHSASAGSPQPLIDARSRVWYNPELKSRNFIIPGLIAVIMSVIVALLTSLTIAREWERGTMEQLISTPVKTPELIIGKLIPYFLIGFIDIGAFRDDGHHAVRRPASGSAVLLGVFPGSSCSEGSASGILISIMAKSQLVASQMAIVSNLPPGLPAVGVHVLDREHAEAASGRHPHRSRRGTSWPS